MARCTKIINPNTDDAKYMINVKQIAKFVVALGDKVAPTDIEEGMRVGVDRTKYQIQIPLPPKIDPSVTMMTVEEKPDVTYGDVGGSKEMIDKLREVVEMPLLHPEKFVNLGIDPPKGVLCYGPPGTGKTLLARAVANRTDACFIRVIGSELVQKYVGEGARMVRELFQVRAPPSLRTLCFMSLSLAIAAHNPLLKALLPDFGDSIQHARLCLPTPQQQPQRIHHRPRMQTHGYCSPHAVLESSSK